MNKIAIIPVLITLFHFNISELKSQVFDIEPPLDIPLLLSGNFGELRGTHFHAGIDLKTQSVTGKPVFSIMEGYVSRFKVQAGGYGHALYITHPNGYTSVYGHLQEYYPELEAYLKQQQYNKKSFEVDIYLEKGKFNVGRGEQIGISGNTGRSGGPHLHFELRNADQVPQNVLLYDLPVVDTIAPKFRKLAVYQQIDGDTYNSDNKQMISLSRNGNSYSVDKPLKVGEKVAFGTEVYDFLNGSNNKCGVYSLELFIDSQLIYSFAINEISFSETRFIRSHLDYAEKKLNKRNVHRLFKEPYNKLNIYDVVEDNGIVTVSDSLLHSAKILATDVYGNQSSLSFSYIYDSGMANHVNDTGNVYVRYKEGVEYKNDVFSFSIPAYGVFSNKWLSYVVMPGDDNHFSDIHVIGDELVPVNKYPMLSLKVTEPLQNVPSSKLVIAGINDKDELSSEGGLWKDGSVTAKVSGFGRYVVVADTLAPTISPYAFKNGGWYSASNRISFKINDDLSGIKTYNAYIDGEWALFEYDSKSNTLFYRLDAQKLNKSKEPHSLQIFVLDERNNVQKFEGEFYY